MKYDPKLIIKDLLDTLLGANEITNVMTIKDFF